MYRCVQVCTCVLQVCIGVNMCIGVYMRLQVCIAVNKCVQVCIGVYMRLQVCIGVYRCVQVCAALYTYIVITYVIQRLSISCIFHLSVYTQIERTTSAFGALSNFNSIHESKIN